MSIIPQARFQELLRDIEPSSTTNSNASGAHNDLRDFLRKDETFKKYHVTDFLSGSYKRDTAIRPTKKGDEFERPDIDIIVVTNHTSNDGPNEVYELLHKTLKKQYEVVRRQNHSVGIKYYKADMDVVPAIVSGNKYLIPDRKANKWVPTDPEKHTQWTTERNNAAEGRFKPLVKLVKWYRREHPTSSKKPKGLTLEAMVAECMDYKETDYSELFVKTLEMMAEKYGSCKYTGIVPFVSDPAILGNSLCEGIESEDFIEFYNQLNSDAQKARKAIDGKDIDESTKLMKEILGDRFPKSPSNGKSDSPIKAESLLKPSIIGPASFPDKPLKPNKIAGFAHVV